MGRKYKIRDQEGLYFVTFTIVYWLDLFIRNVYKQAIVDSLNYCQKEKGLEVYAWVIMTSHVHLILRSKEHLSDTIRDMKSHTSLTLRKLVQESRQESRKEFLLWMFERAAKKNKRNTKYQVWQQHRSLEYITNSLAVYFDIQGHYYDDVGKRFEKRFPDEFKKLLAELNKLK